jgi:hypothetical protein
MVYGFGDTGVHQQVNTENLSIFFKNGANRNLFFLMNYSPGSGKIPGNAP